MKTIFISSFHPLISRNIFATPILKHLLAERNVRVVILCPQRSRTYMEEEYGGEGIIVEGIAAELRARDIWMRQLSLAALKTRSVAIKRQADMGNRGAYISSFLCTSIGHMIVRRLSSLLTPRGTFDALFKKYAPTVVFSTDVQNELDVQLMHAARRRKIDVVGMVRSWDNLTIKGLVRVVPDILLVQNEITLSDAVRYHDISQGIVKVVGIPHYDAYGEKKMCERKALVSNASSLGKKIILYVATGDRYIDDNVVDYEVLKMLASRCLSDESIVVRLPIADTVKGVDSLREHDGIFFEQVDKRRFSRRKFVELSREDDRHLQNVLCCADIVVTGPSTMCVDAALFDKPIILIGFDGREVRPYHKSIVRYYDYNHFETILESGGVWYAKSEKELYEALEAYRTSLHLHTEGRKKIVDDQTGGLVGKSCVKLVNTLVAFIDRK